MQAAIVCVDDDWNVLKSLGDQLKRRFGKNHDIELVSSGEDALLVCAELSLEGREIPIIISDQQMSGMDGDELLIQLHSLYPKTIKMMLTGQANANSVGNLVNASALYRYISKPWKETDLILTVSEALSRFQQQRQLREHNELLKSTNIKLNNSLSLLLATLESTVDGILILDSEGRVVSFNQGFSNIWNLNNVGNTVNEEHLLEKVLEQLDESEANYFRQVLAQANLDKRKTLLLKNGHTVEYYLRPQQLMGEIVGRVWSFRDVTQELEEKEVLKQQAWHDSLTCLPNRLFFSQKLNETLVEAKQLGYLACVMFLDLDRFKPINDTHGHAIGDRLLQSTVQRFLSCLREADVLGRWGGDEFVLLIPQIKGLDDAQRIAQKIITVVQPNFQIENHELDISTSIGFAIYPYDGEDSETLLHHADAALYEAKRAGRNQYRHYHKGLSNRVTA